MSYTLIKELPDGTLQHCITAPMAHCILNKDLSEPRVNDAFAVYSMSRWYQTSLVQEILKAEDKRIKFRTLNNVYILEDNS